MDKGQHCLIYSVDMSAAFDLLRPDSFEKLLKNSLEPGIFNILIDFLADRKFLVRVEDADLSLENLDRGCVQGSVLRPALFSLYCKDLPSKLDKAFTTSYADDTYVILSSGNLADLLELTKITMDRHFNYLDQLGMVVNKEKTE